jgi:hypothetical protein
MWTSAHIDILWTSFRTLWDSRNGKVHGVDTSTRAKARQEKTHRELRALYEFRINMRHRDWDIFHPTVEAHIEAQPVWAIQNWLKIHVPVANTVPKKQFGQRSDMFVRSRHTLGHKILVHKILLLHPIGART